MAIFSSYDGAVHQEYSIGSTCVTTFKLQPLPWILVVQFTFFWWPTIFMQWHVQKFMIPKVSKSENVVLQISLDLIRSPDLPPKSFRCSGWRSDHPPWDESDPGNCQSLHLSPPAPCPLCRSAQCRDHVSLVAHQPSANPWWKLMPQPHFSWGIVVFSFYVKKLIKIRARTWTQEVHGEKIASSSFTSKPASKYGSGRFLSSCKRNVSALYARQSSGLAISNHEFPEQTT